MTNNLPIELTIWNDMNPMQRLAVMQKVQDCKSISQRFRLCVAYIKANLEDFR